jgi:REP element-mobilizing transposase RayT
MSQSLAYHLIWTTYGTWLPGDARGWIKSGVPGIQEPDPALEQRARDMMAESEVRLTPAQRAAVGQTIRKHCQIRNWILHAVNVRRNHVHVVVTCTCDGEKARDELKLWGSRCLSDLAGLTTPVARKAGRRHWWTEKGECKTIDTPEYLENAVQYVTDMQGD